MQKDTLQKDEPRMHRALNLRDVVLLNISCIAGLSSLSQAAQFGFASMPLWILAILVFLIPSGLMVAELNARMPEEGGLYLWTRQAFGDWHGYVAAWTYWLSNIVWLPTVLLLISASCLYVFGDAWLDLADNPWYNGLVCLGFLWLVTLLNVVGLERAKWIQNIGGTSIWLCVALLMVAGIIFVIKHGSMHPFSPDKLMPDVTDFSILPFFALLAFAFGGLELAPIMAGEIKDPRRTIPRALIISSIAVGVLYMVGTLMLIFTVKEGEVSIIEGVTQAFYEVNAVLNIPGIGVIGAILFALGTVGLFGSWMTGTARVPFVMGLDHYLPDAFASVHPRWGSPYISLLVQGVILTLLFLASLLGSTVKEAYFVMLDMSIILYFIPFLYMFAALAWHLRKDTGRQGVIGLFQKSKTAGWSVALVGFGFTLFSIVLSVVPTKEIENKGLFVAKVIGFNVLLIGIGLVVYYAKRKKARQLSQPLRPRESLQKYLRSFFSVLLLLLAGFLNPSRGQDADVMSQRGFGYSVAVSGSDIFVGEPLNERIPGRVYLFRRDLPSGRWERSTMLSAPDAVPDDRFGVGLAAAQDRLVITATGGSNQALYTFEKSVAGVWSAKEVMKPSTYGLTGRLLGPVALQDGRLYVLLVHDDGSVHLASFERNNGAWIKRRSSALDISMSDDAMISMTASAGRLFIGDPAYEDGRGVVYESSETDGTVFHEMMGPPRPDVSKPEFGSAVAAIEGRLIVGSPGVQVDSSRVYVFAGDLSSETWSELEIVDSLGAATLEDDSGFGSSLAAEGRIIVVGAHRESFGYGGAFVFEDAGTSNSWSLVQVLEPELASGYPSIVGSDVNCEGGTAGGFSCMNVDLRSFMSLESLGLGPGIQVNDVWGWTDPETGKEYAIVGAMDRTLFIDVSDPNHPVMLGSLPATPGTRPNWWRDVKVYKDHAYIVADNVGNHGMQVFDLTQLRHVQAPPASFSETAHYDGIHSAHNIVINEQTGFAYAVGASGGGETCGGGLHMIDIRDPEQPVFAGCFADTKTGESSTGYTHDAQCVVYQGPDTEYRGREICFGSNETALSIADVTDKAHPVALSRASYPDVGYTHQGWLTEDQRYFYMDDEDDEINGLTDGTRTLIWDVRDLDDPVLADVYVSKNKASDHNLYIKGHLMYQSNYLSGLRILDTSDPLSPVEVGFFDTVPWGEDKPGYGGSWSNYPFFRSGLIVVTSLEEGVFLLKRSAFTP